MRKSQKDKLFTLYQNYIDLVLVGTPEIFDDELDFGDNDSDIGLNDQTTFDEDTTEFSLSCNCKQYLLWNFAQDRSTHILHAHMGTTNNSRSCQGRIWRRTRL